MERNHDDDCLGFDLLAVPGVGFYAHLASHLSGLQCHLIFTAKLPAREKPVTGKKDRIMRQHICQEERLPA